MSILQEFRRDDQRVLDRLVDGELGPLERRELLAALDDEPGAWRRCALAFVESQSWRWQLVRVASEPLVDQATARANRGHAIRSRTFWGACLAIAASLMLAFGLGTRFPAGGPTQDAGEAIVAEPDRDATPRAAASELAQIDADSADESPWETITLAPADGSQGSQEIQIAIIKEGATDREWASAEQSAIPTQLLQQFEKAGLKVTRQHRLWPVDLADGRRLVVPVDEVDVSDPEIVQY